MQITYLFTNLFYSRGQKKKKKAKGSLSLPFLCQRCYFTYKYDTKVIWPKNSSAL